MPGPGDTFAAYGPAWANVSNTPFRNHKVTVYEGGISTPMVVSWPGRIPADRRGQFAREPAHLIDLLPSFLELAGAEAKPEVKLEGQSIVDMLRGAPGRSDRTFAWEHEGHRGIRSGKWKLVRLPDDAAWSLFDVEADRAEQHDVAAEHPEVARDLAAAYDQWAERCGVIPWEQLAPKRPAPQK
jgi:arylsulfatase